MDVTIEPLTPERLPDLRRRSSSRAATRSGAGAPTSGSAAATGPTRPRPRTGRSSARRDETPARAGRPGSSPTTTARSSAGSASGHARTTSGWRSRRSSPRSTTRRSGRSCASSSGGGRAARASPARSSTRPSPTPATTVRRPWRPTRSRSPRAADPVRERLPRHAGDVRAGRIRGRRAPPGRANAAAPTSGPICPAGRCDGRRPERSLWVDGLRRHDRASDRRLQTGPVGESDPARSTPILAVGAAGRPAVDDRKHALGACTSTAAYVIRRMHGHRHPTRVDTPATAGPRLPAGVQIARPRLAHLEAAPNDDAHPAPTHHRAHRRRGSREICAHLELDRQAAGPPTGRTTSRGPDRAPGFFDALPAPPATRNDITSREAPRRPTSDEARGSFHVQTTPSTHATSHPLESPS